MALGFRMGGGGSQPKLSDYIYAGGVLKYPFSNHAWSFSGAPGSFVKSSGTIANENLLLKMSVASTNRITTFFSPALDMTNRSIMHVKISAAHASDGSYIKIGFSNTESDGFTWLKYENIGNAVDRDIDISSLTGSKYVVVTLTSYGLSDSAYVYFDEISFS